MNFIHDHPDFSALILSIERETLVEAALVEKDYWITHTLWALHQTKLDIWFKGGTSLSKGFGIIERFSEDLDLMIERGGATLPDVTNWSSMNRPDVGPPGRAHEHAVSVETRRHFTVAALLPSGSAP